MKVRVSPTLCAAGAFLIACFAAISSSCAAEPNFHHGEWPFNSPVRPAPPSIANAAGAANPIARFVVAALENAGLHPPPQADKAALLRRVTFDLIGLPPTPAELD